MTTRIKESNGDRVMDEIRKLQIDIIRKVIIADLFVIALFVLLSKDYMPLVMGLVFGSAISVLNLILNRPYKG